MPDPRYRLLLPQGNWDPIFRTIQRWADTLPFGAYQEMADPGVHGTTADPAIGNGTQRGSYRLTNDTCEGEISVVFGSTSTFGTGSWFFNMPVAPLNVGVVGYGLLLCAGTSYFGELYCSGTGTSSARGFVRAPAAVNSAAPGTWANGDYLRMNFRYRYK